MHPLCLASALLATATLAPAQTYLAGYDIYNQSVGTVVMGELRSGSIAHTFVTGRNNPGFQFDAIPRSSRVGVDLYAYMWQAGAIGSSSYAFGGWEFDDVVFSGPVPNQPIDVRLSFDVTAGTSGGNCPLGSRFLYQDINVYDQAGNSVAYWNRFVPGSQPGAVAPGTALVTPAALVLRPGFQITTDTTYRFEIRLVLKVDGGQCYSTQSAKAQFSAQPFLLPAGVTADSAQGYIINNTWTQGSPPLITPGLYTSEPVVAGNQVTMYVANAQPLTLGILFTGDSLSPYGAAVAPWVSVDLVNPQTFEVFFTDANGDWDQTYQVPASLGGTQTALQAGVFTGPGLNDVYSTNSMVLSIR